MIKVAPSILAADPLNMGADVQRMIDAGCDMIHVDVMDAHFVPNLSYGPALVKALRARFDVFLDVHLMMDNPGDYLEVFAQAEANGITIHAEIPGGGAAELQRIRAMGLTAGLSVKPATTAEDIRPRLSLADMVLVMTVEPGFGGQRFQSAMLDKLRTLRQRGYTGLLQADGGVSLDNLPELKAAGLDIAVMGTSLYRSEDASEYIRRTHAL